MSAARIACDEAAAIADGLRIVDPEESTTARELDAVVAALSDLAAELYGCAGHPDLLDAIGPLIEEMRRTRRVLDLDAFGADLDVDLEALAGYADADLINAGLIDGPHLIRDDDGDDDDDWTMVW